MNDGLRLSPKGGALVRSFEGCLHPTDVTKTLFRPYVCPAGGYAHFTLRWKPGEKAVSFYVNGNRVLDDYEGEAITTRSRPSVCWGNTASTPAGRKANWAEVTFALPGANPQPAKAR